MIHLTPSFLIAAASAFVGLTQTTGEHGSMVERWMRTVRAKTRGSRGRWDAAFVHHVGFWSHYDHHTERSSWPIPALRSANSLADFAREKNVLDRLPLVGDLFVLWSAAKRRFAHTGIVLDVGGRGEYLNGKEWIECTVLSPNVYPDGTPGGTTISRLHRRFCPDAGDAFVRWVELAEQTDHHRDAGEASAPSDGADLEEAA